MSEWFPKKTVLVPVDFSAPAFDAASVGHSLVADPANLHLLHVKAENIPIAFEGVWVPPADDNEIEEIKTAIRKKADQLGFKDAVAAVRVGSPAEEICAYAKEIGAQIIVIPSHGRTGLAHLLIGSVAERVARHATCPVLILRRND